MPAAAYRAHRVHGVAIQLLLNRATAVTGRERDGRIGRSSARSPDSGSALSIAGLLYSGATLALLALRQVRGNQHETPVKRQDWPALGALTLLGGVVGPLAWAVDNNLSQRLSLRDPLQIATVKAFGAPLP